MTDSDSGFAVQAGVRGPWRAYLDEIAPLRPELHRYCCGLTGSLWDGEDLVQDTLLKVFGLLGKINADIEHPRAYLIRTATHLWIDRLRRAGVERNYLVDRERELGSAGDDGAHPTLSAELRDATSRLFARLPPQERAAVLLKDVLDFSLDECAALLQTSVGAVKAALHRGRGRLREAAEQPDPPERAPSELVDRFIAALAARDFDALRAMCRQDVTIEMVGGATFEGFEAGKPVFEHAHVVWPEMGLGENPRWECAFYEGEAVVLGFRTRNAKEGLNEAWRLRAGDGGLERVRLYCFCPDTLHALARELGLRALRRPYRSP